MRRRLFVAVWLAGTVGATLLAWAAVRQVTDEVGPHRPLPLPTALVAAAGDGRTDTTPAPRRPEPQNTEQGARENARETPAAQQPADAAPAPVTQSYRLVGGIVSVRYAGGQARLVSATPATGFTVEVNASAPEVDVRFRSNELESRLRARWFNGRPDVETEEKD